MDNKKIPIYSALLGSLPTIMGLILARDPEAFTREVNIQLIALNSNIEPYLPNMWLAISLLTSIALLVHALHTATTLLKQDARFLSTDKLKLFVNIFCILLIFFLLSLEVYYSIQLFKYFYQNLLILN